VALPRLDVNTVAHCPSSDFIDQHRLAGDFILSWTIVGERGVKLSSEQRQT
jgi:ABC-type multidrug transport system fused ATPase/permease subunit